MNRQDYIGLISVGQIDYRAIHHWYTLNNKKPELALTEDELSILIPQWQERNPTVPIMALVAQRVKHDLDKEFNIVTVFDSNHQFITFA